MKQETVRRIERLQKKGGNAEVLRLIESGACYEDLSEAEKEAYNRYRGFDSGFEALNAAYAACMGIDVSEIRTPLEKRPTPEELEARRKQLAEWMEESDREYNSPEAVAKREAEYAELQRIGELRRQDFMCGRDMDKCHPLPWK